MGSSHEYCSLNANNRLQMSASHVRSIDGGDVVEHEVFPIQ
jgi:hypothetical protein